MKKHLYRAIALLLVVMAIVPAATAQDQFTATRYATSTSTISTLDPQVMEDSVSLGIGENLYVGLTDYHPETAQIRPELATSWEISEDGLFYTFNLRDDIPWVKYDAEAAEFEVQRMTNAYDVEYGIRRMCDPMLGSNYSYLVGPLIKGCGELLNSESPEELTPEDFETVGVSALDDVTLQIELAESRGYFFSMSAMWTLYAVPVEVIEEFGMQEWYLPENIWTNGAYGLESWERGVKRSVIRNPYYPEDMVGPGNIYRWETSVVEDINTRYALYQDNQSDSTTPPRAEVKAFVEAYPEEAIMVSDLGVYYIGFAYDKPPFDNVHMRRALSALFDREGFVTDVMQGQGIPMIHFAPPGIFGAPPINEVGIGYDPEFAKEQLELAGYPECEGMPQVIFAVYQTAIPWIEFLVKDFEEIGCDPEQFTIESMEFSVLLQITDDDTPTEERPNAWTLIWGPDYADENNWVYDVLHCDTSTRMKRPCTEIDDQIIAAAAEPQPETRVEMYREIEEAFFGPDGEVPIAPFLLRLNYIAVKPWYDGPFDTDALFGGAHYDWYFIDSDAQAEARGE